MKSTRKMDCPAHIIIKEYCLYPEFQISNQENTHLKISQVRALKKAHHQSITEAIKQEQSLKTESRYFVSLPLNEAHENIHPTGKVAGMSQRVDPLISRIIEELVREGTTDVHTVKKILKHRIKHELKDCPPDTLDRAFNPSKDDIKNHIYAAKRAIELSKLDQENLSQKIEGWKSSKTSKHFFRPFIKKELDQGDSESQFSQMLIWVHQEEWQQKLLEKYGNIISLIDATYKTTKYDLPLFFVSVRTNVGYCVVAEFVVQTETTQQILEALQILRTWNPKWNPPFFLCDYSEAEISALEQAFPGIMVYLCDFHREQAWTRWVRNRKNGLGGEESERLLELLRNCAWAPEGTQENQLPRDALYKQAVDLLKQSPVWQQHENVRSWLTTTWLCIPQVCA